VHLPLFSLKYIEVDAPLSQHATAIQHIFETRTAQHVLGMYPVNNSILVPKNDILADIYALDSRIQHLSLSVRGPRLILHSTLFEPSFVYVATVNTQVCLNTELNVPVLSDTENPPACSHAQNIQGVGETFWLTKEGYVYDEAPKFIGAPLPIFTTPSSDDVRVGSRIPSDIMAYAQQIQEISNTYGLFLHAFRLEQEGDIVVNFGYHWDVFATKRKTAQENIEQLVLALRELGPLAFEQGGALTRIDVRFGNKVFYK
jgi:hypothetical protein